MLAFIFGGYGQNKADWVCEQLSPYLLWDGVSCTLELAAAAKQILMAATPLPVLVLDHFTAWVRRGLAGDFDLAAELDELFELAQTYSICLISDEIGQGLIPVEAADRRWREQCGRLGTRVAARADVAVRLYYGLPLWLKGSPQVFQALATATAGSPEHTLPSPASAKAPQTPTETGVWLYVPEAMPEDGTLTRAHVLLTLIRHGETQPNLERRYISDTDVLLTPEGAESLRRRQAEGIYPQAERVASSPLLRCRETAKLIYGREPDLLLPTLRERAFGPWEGLSHADLQDETAYTAWIASAGETTPAGVESQADFSQRISKALEHLASFVHSEGVCNLAIVTHGGVIMEIMRRAAGNDPSPYAHQLANGEFRQLILAWH